MKETLALTPALPMNRPTSGPSQEGNSASVPDIGSPPPERLGVGSWSQLTSKKWRCSLSRNLVATDLRRISSSSDFGFRIWSNEPHVGCYGSAVQCAKFFQEILPKGSASRRIQEFSVPSWLAGSLAPPKQPTTKKEAGVIRPLRRSHALLLRAEEQVPCADAGRVRAVVVAGGHPGCSRIQAGGGIQRSAPGPGHGHHAAGDTDVCDLYLRGTDDLVIRFDRVRIGAVVDGNLRVVRAVGEELQVTVAGALIPDQPNRIQTGFRCDESERKVRRAARPVHRKED